MEVKKGEILGNLVDCYSNLSVPEFQRAYSWEEAQLKRWVDDLNDAIESENSYYYGHFLLLRDGDKAKIIDGQQRLTTVVIFMAVVKNLFGKELGASSFVNNCLTRFETVDDDKLYFKDHVIDSTQKKAKTLEKIESESFPTQSQHRICWAYNFFIRTLTHLKSDLVMKYIKKLEGAEVTKNEISDISRATQIFSFQNDRGKELTNLEKVKAFCAYQYYLLPQGGHIEHFYARFKTIYRSIERINIPGIDEDSVLRDCLDAFYFFFNGNEFEDYFKNEVKTDKLEWLDQFSKRLEQAFIAFEHLSSYRKMEGKFSRYMGISLLNQNRVFYPFFLRLNEQEPFNPTSVPNNHRQLFKVFEQLLFRATFNRNRAKLEKHLNWEDNLACYMCDGYETEALVDFIRDIWLDRENFHWSINLVKNNLLGKVVYGGGFSSALLSYILWQYECSLSESSTLPSISWDDFPSKSIEHIAPQSIYGNWNDEEREEDGYDFWDEIDETPENPEWWAVFDQRMHGWGNLALVTRSENSILSNRPLEEKLDKFDDKILYQHKYIKDYVEAGSWTGRSIDRRCKDIEDFIVKRWLLPWGKLD